MTYRLSSARVLAIAFLGGLTFLIFEVSWFRLLSLVLGATVSASTVVLAAFMGGFGFGAWFWGRESGKRLEPSSLLILVMAGAGITGLLGSLAIQTALPAMTGGALLFAALGLVFVPAFFMGGLIPAAAALLVLDRAHLARRMGELYAWETLGSTFGALSCGFVFIRLLGQKNTVLCAVLVDLACAALVWRWRVPAAAESVPPARAPRKTRNAEAILDPVLDRRAALFGSAAFGFAVLGLEVAWLRCFRVYLTNTSHTFAVITAVVTLGLFAGSRLFAAIGEKHVRPRTMVNLTLAAAGAVLAGLVILLNLPGWIMFPLAGDSDAYAVRVLVIPLVAAALIAFPVTVLSGFAFPLACTLHARSGDAVSLGAGRVLLVNTLGGIAGPLLTAFVLIPVCGAAKAVAFHLLPLLFVAWALSRAEPRARIIAGAAAVVALFVAAAPAPRILPPSFSRFGREILEYHEAVEGTFVVGREPGRSGAGLATYVNNSAVIGSTYDAIKVVKMVGHLPFYLGLTAKDVLVVGFGIGVTTSAIASHPEVRKIECVELVPGVARAAHYYEGLNSNVHESPKLQVIAGDGRYHLGTTDRTYDLISSDPTHPILGSGSLYTREYFELCHARLTPDGMVSQYLPLHKLLERDLLGIIKTFYDVFPGATVWLGHNHAVLLGAKKPLRIDFSSWAKAIGASPKDEFFYAEPYHLAACLVLDGEATLRFPPGIRINTDDRPLTEFFDLESLSASNLVTNLAWLNANRSGVERVFSSVPDSRRMERYLEGHRMLVAGLQMQLSGNPRGMMEKLVQAARVNPENAEYPLLMRFHQKGPR